MLHSQFEPHPGWPSHASPNDISTMPSPQYGAAWHCDVHLPMPYADAEFAEPWSHCSCGLWTMPSPQ